ncbi:alpha/beta hydrolase-fold protein [Bizionia paragorgiae]|jgi:predicted alpha/beta superfamily hydrolase|uniref:alpha/beta hydrolase n=1 Tax=Bizionia paragorgiae TaxID=283786 RepID=UPI00299E2144|nr:alpha/beta hydrolase-fold protein [Bizionia paragorgiae]MDX1271800.1 alpha/beta hydrolase-fold protein [Bizionia paragorgiae]
MRKLIFLFIVVFSFQQITAQISYKNFESQILGESRQLKIQLPRGYDKSDKSYPIIFTFDGDYLFELAAGTVDYYAYWDDIPECIVVGVNQFGKRDDDTAFSELNSLPIEKGEAFFNFVGQELVPYINKTYRTEKFKVAIGHDKTANFINYFLLKEDPLFQAYIVLSPDLAPDMESFLSDQLSAIESKLFYYLATSSNDIKSLKEKTEALQVKLAAIDNKNVLKAYDNFDGPSHYSLPAYALPKALESIFLVFQPISKEEYQNTLLKLESSPVDYLTEKYETIEELFGIKKQISINDFRAIAATINKTEQFDYFEDLGKLARKQYPETLLGHYYLGRYYETTGRPKKAMKTYQSGYVLQEVGGITKDQMLELSQQLKVDFGL